MLLWRLAEKEEYPLVEHVRSSLKHKQKEPKQNKTLKNAVNSNTYFSPLLLLRRANAIKV